MNGFTFLVAVVALGLLVAIPWAMALDRRDRAAGKTVHTFEFSLYLLRRRFQVLGCTLAASLEPLVMRISDRLDRMDEYHIMHGPKSGCTECAGK